jgi:hypothetical protein
MVTLQEYAHSTMGCSSLLFTAAQMLPTPVHHYRNGPVNPFIDPETKTLGISETYNNRAERGFIAVTAQSFR